MEKLTRQEEDVMRQVWQLGRCGIKEILDRLPDPRPPYTTVASVVNKLKRKRYVRQARDGKAYVYEPAIAEADYKKRLMSGFVHDYFLGSFKDMVCFFARDEKLSEQDLRDIIREIEQS
jgi:predicted transcriptional regulator